MSDITELSNFFDSLAAKFTPEYFEQCAKDSYKQDREYPENFSNWYPHIINYGNFNKANLISNQIFTYEQAEILRKCDNYNNVDWNELNEILKPTTDKLSNYTCYHIKNGCFSNKFNFDDCIATKDTLAQKLWNINYQSAMFDTGGYTELVVRELIPFELDDDATIYNGMPLREEVRVFYNIDTREIEYIEDYWNYEYCRPNIRNKSDGIIFDWFHNKFGDREIDHNKALEYIINKIQANIHTLEFDSTMSGIWSIDFLYYDKTDSIYLIDMARGFRSAYWNPDKLKNKTKVIENEG